MPALSSGFGFAFAFAFGAFGFAFAFAFDFDFAAAFFFTGMRELLAAARRECRRQKLCGHVSAGYTGGRVVPDKGTNGRDVGCQRGLGAF